MTALAEIRAQLNWVTATGVKLNDTRVCNMMTRIISALNRWDPAFDLSDDVVQARAQRPFDMVKSAFRTAIIYHRNLQFERSEHLGDVEKNATESWQLLVVSVIRVLECGYVGHRRYNHLFDVRSI